MTTHSLVHRRPQPGEADPAHPAEGGSSEAARGSERNGSTYGNRIGRPYDPVGDRPRNEDRQAKQAALGSSHVPLDDHTVAVESAQVDDHLLEGYPPLSVWVRRCSG